MTKTVLHRVRTWPVAVYFSALLHSIRPHTLSVKTEFNPRLHVQAVFSGKVRTSFNGSKSSATEAEESGVHEVEQKGPSDLPHRSSSNFKERLRRTRRDKRDAG